jgi:hypothetical protein
MDNFVEALLQHGFVQKMPCMYCYDFDRQWTGYVILEKEHFRFHSIGLINQPINRIVNFVAKRVAPPSPVKIKFVSYGPALFSLAPLTLKIDDFVEGESSASTSVTTDELTSPSDNPHGMTDTRLSKVMSFLEIRLNLRSALDTALTYNKFMHAQRLSIPVGLLLLGNRWAFDEYVAEVINTLKEHSEKKLYESFIELLVVEFPNLQKKYFKRG